MATGVGPGQRTISMNGTRRFENAPPDGIVSRRLVRDGLPALELLETKPDGAAGRASSPLLLVHGAFAGAWSWSEVFLPFFGRRARHAAALSMRGHGGSEGSAELRRAGLEDLIADIVLAIEDMPEPPVVIGHSLGGYLAQLLIGRAQMKGLVLLGSLPPDGLALVGPRLAVTDTKIWAEAVSGTIADSKPVIDLAGLQVLFGEGVPPDRARLYASRMVPEAPAAMAEAHLPRPVMSAIAAGLPTLVLNGNADRLVWPATAFRTALYHGAEHHFFDGGHFLMLDPVAEEVARRVLDWLDERGL